MSRRRANPFAALLIVLAVLMGATAPAAAQYGGLAGLFVTISPTDPNRADFFGFGCRGGIEVVLYVPALSATNSDPNPSSTQVTGRVLGVTTTVSSSDPELNGTFTFDNLLLPTDVPRAAYEVHSRCGGLDLDVLVEFGFGRTAPTGPGDPRDPTNPRNQTDPSDPNNSDPPIALPFTGRESSRVATYGLLLVTAGSVLLIAARKRIDSSNN